MIIEEDTREAIAETKIEKISHLKAIGNVVVNTRAVLTKIQKMMSRTRIIQWNIQGVKNNKPEIIRFLSRFKADILALQ